MDRYKGILLDIDNTLYDYENCHTYAMEKCIELMKFKFQVDKSEFIESFLISRKKIHQRLKNTAASHNRLLYFQGVFEILGINSLNHSLELYNCYWDNFIEKIEPFEGIHPIFQKYDGKICFVTDLTAHIQFRKLRKLKLNNTNNFMVTSEEAGVEKPNKEIFHLALKKLNLRIDEVCMIGDNFEKDIIGASNLNMDTIWINFDKQIQNVPKNCSEINSFSKIDTIL